MMMVHSAARTCIVYESVVEEPHQKAPGHVREVPEVGPRGELHPSERSQMPPGVSECECVCECVCVSVCVCVCVYVCVLECVCV